MGAVGSGRDDKTLQKWGAGFSNGGGLISSGLGFLGLDKLGGVGIGAAKDAIGRRRGGNSPQPATTQPAQVQQTQNQPPEVQNASQDANDAGQPNDSNNAQQTDGDQSNQSQGENKSNDVNKGQGSNVQNTSEAKEETDPNKAGAK